MKQAVGEAPLEERDFTQWRHYDVDPELPDVLKAALNLFVTLGYHGTSVRAIAMEAGMTVPGLYYHFETKQAMLVALLRRSNSELRLRGEVALSEAGDNPRDRFIALIENLVLYMTNRHQLAHLAREIRGLTEPFKSRHIEMRDELKATVLTEVIAGRALGYFSVDDPHEATRAVLVLCEGVAEWYRPGGLKSPDEIASRYVRFALSLVEDTARPG